MTTPEELPTKTASKSDKEDRPLIKSPSSLVSSDPGHPWSGQEYCVIDGQLIQMQIFKGSGVCCERCRKVRDKEPAHEKGKKQ